MRTESRYLSLVEGNIIISSYNTIMVNGNLHLSCRVYGYGHYTYTKSRNFFLYSFNLDVNIGSITSIQIVSLRRQELDFLLVLLLGQ
jgi:hypothetical protein